MLKKQVFMKMEILKKKTRFISILIISLLFASCSSDLDITKFTDEEISEKFSYSDDGVLYFKKKLYTGKIIKYNYVGGELEFDLRNKVSGEPNLIECSEITPQGSIVVFPSDTWHRVKPLIKAIL